MEFQVTLDNFEGPMDLLLHFVKETKLDIYEIKMSEIIDKYLEYIHTVQDLNIDVSSSFLVMAATLVHIKSKKLIGKTKEQEESEDEFAIESEEELQRRILEYEQYQTMTKEFRKLEEKRQEVFTKIPESLKDFELSYSPINEDGLTTMDLLNALKMIEERNHYKEPKNTRITRKEISVASRRMWIRKQLEHQEKCEFTALFEVPTKEYIIATFLAILEMSKERLIQIKQDKIFDEIWVWRMEQ